MCLCHHAVAAEYRSTNHLGVSQINLSTRPEKSVGDDDVWARAETALQGALKTKGWAYTIDAGGGAFYGPKIDIKIKDAIGRKWQCSTVQLDFNLPERFGMDYKDSDGSKQRPIMVHRAIFGSLERFFGILVENYAGTHCACYIAVIQCRSCIAFSNHCAALTTALNTVQTVQYCSLAP